MVPPNRAPSDLRLANRALQLALEWGESWLAPIHARLQQIRPDLTSEELDTYAADTRRVFEHALKVGRVALSRHGLEGSVAADEIHRVLRADFPWLDQANLSHLVSQSLYYALK